MMSFKFRGFSGSQFRRGLIPKKLKAFFGQVASDRFQIVVQQFIKFSLVRQQNSLVVSAEASGFRSKKVCIRREPFAHIFV